MSSLPRRVDALTERRATLKRRIRDDRAELQEVAAARRRLIEQMTEQFGIEVVLVDGDGVEQGVEETTHGRHKEEAH